MLTKEEQEEKRKLQDRLKELESKEKINKINENHLIIADSKNYSILMEKDPKSTLVFIKNKNCDLPLLTVSNDNLLIPTEIEEKLKIIENKLDHPYRNKDDMMYQQIFFDKLMKLIGLEKLFKIKNDLIKDK